MKSILRVVLVLGIVVIAAVVLAYRNDIDAAFERVSTGSRIVQTPCGPIEYASAGEGDPVLVVHGAGGGFDQGMDFAKGLAAGGLRVIAMSRFGYLRTPLPPDASPAAQADAHACLLDALGLKRAAIVGASAGAPPLLPRSSARFSSAVSRRIEPLDKSPSASGPIATLTSRRTSTPSCASRRLFCFRGSSRGLP